MMAIKYGVINSSKQFYRNTVKTLTANIVCTYWEKLEMTGPSKDLESALTRSHAARLLVSTSDPSMSLRI